MASDLFSHNGRTYSVAEYDTAPLSTIGERDPNRPQVDESHPLASTVPQDPDASRLPEPPAGSLAAAKLALRRVSEASGMFESDFER